MTQSRLATDLIMANDQPTGSVRMSDIQKILEAKEVIAQNKPVKGDEEESTTSELESAAE